MVGEGQRTPEEEEGEEEEEEEEEEEKEKEDEGSRDTRAPHKEHDERL